MMMKCLDPEIRIVNKKTKNYEKKTRISIKIKIESTLESRLYYFVDGSRGFCS